MRSVRSVAWFACVLAWASLARAAVAAQADPDLFAGMKARSIGPAGMSGRIAAIDAVVADPDVLYVGAATGGVWKSEDGGLTWTPIFDDQPVAAIGAVAIFQRNPDLVWVGTGEGNPRNSASVGNGVYKSADGGRTWRHLGLERSERIHRIVLHPDDPDVAYVAALGPTWGDGDERGVFRTTDGGATWEKVLYVDERTGAADLAMDPSNPRKLLAAMWDHRRWPWFFRSGGPGSGLYLTLDGGDTWRKLGPSDGLPEGTLGRIGVAIAPSDPRIVYAYVETEKKNAIVRSDDGGFTWRVVNEGGRNIGNRPFYYADLRVDPANPNRVYSLWSRVSVSEDGGRTWRVLVGFRNVHPDHHAMWIDPNDPEHIVEGNDGGVYMSRDRGRTWRFVSNLPLAQYYHIDVDDRTPYWVYGGMQDNGSWAGPSAVWENGGIRNHHWDEVGFGDGFRTLPIPGEPWTGYSMSQEGYLRRWNLRTGERKDIRPAPPAPEVELRFNWNAGIAIDPFDPNTVYFGSQFVHRSRDRGDTWEVISPDLTTNNPEWQRQAESGGLTPDVTGAENFTTIVAIAPSPVQRGVLWVGTDDGRLHVTRDGGATWESVERNVRGVPPNTWIPHIEASPHDAGTAFVVFDNHRRNDLTPYVFKTTDFGRRWTSLATPEIRGYALDIEQDPVDPDLLFLGTEFGLYVSLDGGRRWFKWTHGLPTVAVREVVVHPRDADLVIGTHGRSAYILDDIRPLRAWTPEIARRPIHLFEIPDAQQYRVKQTGASRFPGHGEFRGENRPYGALLTYWLNVEGLPHPRDLEERAEPRGRRDREGPTVTIEVRDTSGAVIRTFETPAHLGMNRAVWDLRRDPFREPPRDEEEDGFGERGGPEVLPGTYTVRVRYGSHEASGAVRVLPDPRFEIPQEARREKYAAILRAGALQETVADAVARILDTRADVDRALAKAAADTVSPEGKARYGELRDAARALRDRLAAAERRLWIPPDTKGIVAETDALSKIRYVLGSLQSSWDAPTPAQRAYLAHAESVLEDALAELARVYAEDVAAFREKVRAAGIEFVTVPPPLTVPRP